MNVGHVQICPAALIHGYRAVQDAVIAVPVDLPLSRRAVLAHRYRPVQGAVSVGHLLSYQAVLVHRFRPVQNAVEAVPVDHLLSRQAVLAHRYRQSKAQCP